MIYPFSVMRVFFSLRCNFKCGYCSMMSQDDLWNGDKFKEADPDQWIAAFKRLQPTRDLIITPCNAEPPIYEGCADITNEGLRGFRTHMYTNLSDLSMKEIRKMERRDNLAFYVSYHRGQIDLDEFIANAKELLKIHNVINFHAPMYPPFRDMILEDARKMKEHGVILDTTHEYLGMYKGKMHYSYLGGGEWIQKRLAHRLEGTPKRKVLCKTSFNHDSFYSRTYTVAPDGNMYTCWRHLYNKNESQVIGNFFDENFELEDKHYVCEDYGDCNMCAWHKNIKDFTTGEQLDIDTASAHDNTVSVCMIVKDEESLIRDAIYSVLSWADEIILVDTGSTDNTVKEAVGAGGDKLKVFHYEWNDNFSEARNYAMSKATKEWIFTLDADERVAPNHGEALKKMMNDISQDILVVTVCNLYGKEKIAQSIFPQLRFFRRSAGIMYVGAVHNKPLIPGGSTLNRIPFQIFHLGYDLDEATMLKKHERVVRMCRKFAEEEPDSIEPWYHLLRALKVVRNGTLNVAAKDEMYAAIEKGLALGDGTDSDKLNSIDLQFLNVSGWIYHAFGEHQKAIDLAARAIKIKPDYLDAILLTAMAYVYGVDARQGEEWLWKYLLEQEKYDFDSMQGSLVMEHANSRIKAYETLIAIEQWRNRRAAQIMG